MFIMVHRTGQYYRFRLVIFLMRHKFSVFLHIGKSGGTSFDSMMTSLVHHKCNSSKLLIGHKHFDWSFITGLTNRQQPLDVLGLLRHPVERTKSHFYFSQTLDWTKSSPTRNKTLEYYFKNIPLMMTTRGIWFDGESSVAWLSGLHR